MPRTLVIATLIERLCPTGPLVRASTLIIGVIFLISAFLKSIRPGDTTAALGAIADPNSFTPRLFIYTLVAVEMALAGVLIAHVRPRRALIAASSLLTIFTFWIVWLLIIGWREGCGCGSWTPTLDPTVALWLALARNVVLLFLAWLGIRASRHITQPSWSKEFTGYTAE